MKVKEKGKKERGEKQKERREGKRRSKEEKRQRNHRRFITFIKNERDIMMRDKRKEREKRTE